MKAIVKFVAPATLVLAALSANAAGIVETDYPFDQAGAYSAAQPAATTDAGQRASAPLGEAGSMDDGVGSAKDGSRNDVQIRAGEPRWYDTGHNA